MLVDVFGSQIRSTIDADCMSLSSPLSTSPLKNVAAAAGLSLGAANRNGDLMTSVPSALRKFVAMLQTRRACLMMQDDVVIMHF